MAWTRGAAGGADEDNMAPERVWEDAVEELRQAAAEAAEEGSGEVVEFAGQNCWECLASSVITAAISFKAS